MQQFDIKHITSCLFENGQTVFFTITNKGYIDYTENMLTSLKPFGLDTKVLIISIDEHAAKHFEEKGYYTYCVNMAMSEFFSYKEDGFDKVCYIKLFMICKILAMGYNVFYTDGDIVYVKNPIAVIEGLKDKTGDAWIQNDTLTDNNYNNVCAGFMYIRSNDITRKYFDIEVPEFVKRYTECTYHNNDQTYLNRYIIPYLNLQLFPLDMFPNGNYFYRNSERLRDTMVMVHFNWVVGHEKKAQMMKYGMWLNTNN